MTASSEQRSVRRPVVVTSILLVLAAVLLVALRPWFDRTAAEIEVATEPSVTAEAGPVEPVPEPEFAVEPVAAVSPPATAVPIPVTRPAEPKTVVMLPARVAGSDPEAAAVTEAVLQSTLRTLRSFPNVNVVEVGSAEYSAIVPPNAGPLDVGNLAYLAVTRRHEGDVVVEISDQTRPGDSTFGVKLATRRRNGGGSSGSDVRRNGDPGRGEDAESLGIRYADQIANRFETEAQQSSLESPSRPVTADARSVLLDPTRSEEERLRSLSQLLNEGLDSAAVAAAIDLATRSASAETREGVWSLLRQRAYEPALAQPLSYVLLSDVDAAVRNEAARGLAAYQGDATASAALNHAAQYDASSEVRLTAQMARMDYDEQQSFMRETLLDRNLTPAERLAPTMVDHAISIRMGSPDRVSAAAAMEEALAYAEIAAAVEDAALKRLSLSELQMRMIGPEGPIFGRSSTDDEKMAGYLIEISREADERVRRQALDTLTFLARGGGNAEVRAVLEAALENEPALAADLGIAEALGRPPRSNNPAR